MVKPQSCARPTTAQMRRWAAQQRDAVHIAKGQFVDMPRLRGVDLREAVRGRVCNCGGAGEPRVSGYGLRSGSLCVGRYAEAAELREKLREAKERTDAALGRRSAQAEAVAPRCLRLGQRVTHAVHGYRGVICGRVAPADCMCQYICVLSAACLVRKDVLFFVAGRLLFKGTNAGSTSSMHSHGSWRGA